jgi:hypothetical protein
MDEEGQDFVHAFGQAFGNVAHTERRVKAERRAGMTSKQRARREQGCDDQLSLFGCDAQNR